MVDYFADKPDYSSRLMWPCYDPIPHVLYWSYEPYEYLDPAASVTWDIDHSSVDADLFFTSISLVSVEEVYCDMEIKLNSSAIFHDVAILISQLRGRRNNPLVIHPSDTLQVKAYNRNATAQYYELWATAYEVVE